MGHFSNDDVPKFHLLVHILFVTSTSSLAKGKRDWGRGLSFIICTFNVFIKLCASISFSWL